MRWLLAAVWLSLAIPVTHTARADAAADEKVTGARTAFERGAKAAAEERWGDALAAFEESSALRPHATTTYNIGYCERARGHAVRARQHFALALVQDKTSGGTELTEELRQSANKYLEETRAQIATPKLVVPAGVTITVDGRPLEPATEGLMLAGTRNPGPGEKVPSTSFSIEIDAGAHEVVIAAPDGRSKVAHEYFPPGSTKEVRMELPPPAPAPAPLVDTNKSRRMWGYVIGGVGIVGMGIGTYFGMSARSKWGDATDGCPNWREPGATCSGSSVDLGVDARRDANISTIAFVAGGAALVGGTILVLTSTPSERPRASVGGAVDPRGVAWLSLSGSF